MPTTSSPMPIPDDAAVDLELRLLDDRLAGWGFPRYGSALAAGLDLHACVEAPLDLAAGAAPTLVSAGFAMRIGEPGWCGVVAPRSGLGHRGLVLGNAIGIIDADYDGPVLLSAWNRNPAGTEPIRVAPGDRIAQLIVVRAERPRLRVVPGFATRSARGAGGFGSTGQAGAGSAGR